MRKLLEGRLGYSRENELPVCAGQERTPREHTCYKRMQELVDVLERYLSSPERRACKTIGHES
jgi:hypothetical protein